MTRLTPVGVNITFKVFELEVINMGASTGGIVRTRALVLVVIAIGYEIRMYFTLI
jgi:hypothetical protein